MSRLLLVAFPKLDSVDYDWIQNLRREHNEYSYRAIEPHFTLFRASSVFTKDELYRKTKENLTRATAFNFTLRSALFIPPAGPPPAQSDYAFVFLTPDEGFSRFVKLRDQIYTQGLEKALTLDLPFVPHINLATSQDISRCKALADQWNQQRIEIHGRVESVAMLQESRGAFDFMDEIKLG